MPFTPFHMGPALAVKAATRRYFNVPVFAFTQVGIDSEVLIGLPFREDLTNHAVLHTLGGGALIAIIAILLLRPVIQPGARLWNHLAGVKPDSFMYMETRVPRSAAVISAVIGSGSHVLLDAMSHPDMTPKRGRAHRMQAYARYAPAATYLPLHASLFRPYTQTTVVH